MGLVRGPFDLCRCQRDGSARACLRPKRGVHSYYNYLLNLMRRANMMQILSGDEAIPPNSMTVEGVLDDLVVCGKPARVAE
jgi:hypothetical protein